MSSVRRAQGASSTLVVGSQSDLAATARIPELLAIDKEIGHPAMMNPLVYNSEAWSRRLELPWAIGAMRPFEGISMLDVGSGASPLPFYLSRHGANVVSVDPEVMRDLPRDGARRVQCALPRLPFREASFDIVCCISVLEHLPFFIDECFTELCRIARRRVILTFDVALSPIAVVGLSAVELKALSRAVKKKLEFPKKPLEPTAAEKGIWVTQLAVCMFQVDRTDSGWPMLRFSKTQRAMIKLHRRVQRWAGIMRKQMLRTRDRVLAKRHPELMGPAPNRHARFK
jgi:ubiquinone/menaquinone biosynthesis C-methylase UbiE